MSRRRRLGISLVIGAIPIAVTALVALWSTPEGGGDADTCGSFAHVQLASGHCQEVRIGYYLFSVGIAIVAGLLLAAVVYGATRFWPGSGPGGIDSLHKPAELAPGTTDDLPWA
jgi:hypothetical protein